MINKPIKKDMLMEEILHHLGYKNLVDNGRNYILVSTGAGFLPTSVFWKIDFMIFYDILCLVKKLSSSMTCDDHSLVKGFSFST